MQSIATQKPAQSDSLVRLELPHSRGEMLASRALHLIFAAEPDGALTVTAARLSPSGEETAILTFVVPESRKKQVLESLSRKGLRQGECTGFDEACALLEQSAHEIGACCERSIPVISRKMLGEGEASQLESFTQRAKAPAEERDPLTGLPGKSLLLGPEALHSLCQRIPGDKVLAFLDFNNMGLANKVGLGKEVDTILREMERAGNEAFGEIPHQLVRLGGDEFAVIVGASGEAAGVALGQFRAALMKLRDSAFANQSDKVAIAESRAERRAAMRGLMSRYKSDKGIGDSDEKGPSPFQKSAFRAWVIDRIREFEPGFLASRSWTGTLVRGLAEREMGDARSASGERRPSRVMSFSIGAVEIGEYPLPQDIERGFDVAEREIHLQKERFTKASADVSAPIPVMAYETLAGLRLREAEEKLLLNQKETEERGAASGADEEAEPLSKTESLVRGSVRWQAGGMDPSLAHNVVRYNLRRDAPFRTLFNPRTTESVSAFILDVNHFGVLNNQLGYPRADALIGRLAKMIQQDFPHALTVRKDGGKLVVITESACSEEAVQVLRHRAEIALKECVNDRVIAEYQMRVALDLWDSGTRGTHLLETGIRRVRLSQSVVTPSPEATLGEVIQQLENAAEPRKHRLPRNIHSSRQAA